MPLPRGRGLGDTVVVSDPDAPAWLQAVHHQPDGGFTVVFYRDLLGKMYEQSEGDGVFARNFDGSSSGPIFRR